MSAAAPLELVVHARTCLFVAGNLHSSARMAITVKREAELSLLVLGAIDTSPQLALASANCRIYTSGEVFSLGPAAGSFVYLADGVITGGDDDLLDVVMNRWRCEGGALADGGRRYPRPPRSRSLPPPIPSGARS